MQQVVVAGFQPANTIDITCTCSPLRHGTPPCSRGPRPGTTINTPPVRPTRGGIIFTRESSNP